MLIFAHRGLHDRTVTENTMPAIERAIQSGVVDGVEFDLRLSRDGEPVVIHDANLHRVAGDSRRVADLTMDELREVVLRGHGSIPSLNDVTSAVPAPFHFDMEVKDPDVTDALIVKLKTSTSLRARTIISSFHADVLRRVRKELPDVRTLYYQRRWPLPFRQKQFFARVTKQGFWGIGFSAQILTKRRIAAIRKHGFHVAAWDEQPLARLSRRVVNLGVDVAVVFKPQSIRRPT